MPDALSYLFCGVKKNEFSIASTSQLLKPGTLKYEERLFTAMGVDSSIMQEIVLGIGGVDGRPEGVDHLGDFGVPQGSVGERRIHRDVGQAVTGLAVGLDFFDARRFFELDRFVVGAGNGRRDGESGGDGDAEYQHIVLP